MKDFKKNSVRIGERKWYPYTIAGCSAVILYVVLINFNSVLGTLNTFLGYFKAIFMGGIFAYLMNPLAKLYQRTIFRGIRKESPKWTLSVLLALVSMLLFLVFLLSMLIPQLVESLTTFINNMDEYISALQKLIEKWGVSKFINIESFSGLLENIKTAVLSFLSKNLGNIINASTVAGKSIVNWVIALILSVYLLSSKISVKNGVLRLMNALIPEKYVTGTASFFGRCDTILIRYIVFSLLDGAIVGVVNAIFMAIMNMQYVGLVSVVVAVTNLIPTFGPVIGAVIGAFVLLLVKPWYALAFLIFTLILQLCDGYVIKPKLFGNSLGVSGLLILIAVIVGGNMFGVLGILLAIPFAAILDFIYQDYILVFLENRKKKKLSEHIKPDTEILN